MHGNNVLDLFYSLRFKWCLHKLQAGNDLIGLLAFWFLWVLFKQAALAQNIR